MSEHSLNIYRPDGMVLHALAWSAEGPERFRVFLGHSHVVHAGLLRPLAQAFATRGCGVLAGDIRGHGRSTSRSQPIAHLDRAAGWQAAVGDFLALMDETFAGTAFERRIIVVPNILALLALEALTHRPDLAGQIVLIAPPPNQPLLARIGLGFAAARARLRDPAAPDMQFLHHIYNYLGSHLPERTHPLDVVSPDRAVIQRILDDPLSWNVPSTAYWEAVFHGLRSAWDWPRGFRLAPGTRVRLLYGEADPMTQNGAFCRPMIAHFLRHGAAEASAEGIAGARSGLFLEEERLGIAARILAWAEAGQGLPPDLPAPPPARAIEDYARDVLSREGAKAEHLTAEEFMLLCYSGIHDEMRWAEILMRMMLNVSERTGDDIETLMSSMMPHWDRAFQLQQQLRTGAALGEVWQDVLDRLGMACALIDAEGHVLHMNQGYGAALHRLFEAPPQAAEDALTRRLIGETAREAGRLDPAGTLLICEGQPAGFFFRPPALDRHSRRLGGPVGLVLLRGQGSGGDAATLLEFAYGLTGQEAQVALGVMRGESPAQIAQRLGVTINTVRSHLAQAYAKTGTAGKAELAAALHASPVGWVAGPDGTAGAADAGPGGGDHG